MDDGLEEVQITSSLGGMRLFLRRAWRIAPPILPVQPVRASILLIGRRMTLKSEG